LSAGGADPDNAWRSGPVAADILPAIGLRGVRFDGLIVLLAGPAPGRYGGDRGRPGHRGAERGSRRARRAAALKGASEAAAPATALPLAEPQPLTAGHPGVPFPRLRASVSCCTEPGRQARRAEGAPLVSDRRGCRGLRRSRGGSRRCFLRSGFERIFGCPLTVEGHPRTLSGPSSDLSPAGILLSSVGGALTPAA
jgi:hypothetical protein